MHLYLALGLYGLPGLTTKGCGLVMGLPPMPMGSLGCYGLPGLCQLAPWAGCGLPGLAAPHTLAVSHGIFCGCKLYYVT